MRNRLTAVLFGSVLILGLSAFQPTLTSRAALGQQSGAARGTAAAAAPTAAAPTASRALASPGCTDAVATAPELPGERPRTVPVPGSPFGVVVAPGGRYAVASVTGAHNALAVLRLGRGAPRLVRTLALPGAG